MDLDVFFVDDSTQKKPSRRGMGKLVGVGGIRISGENVRDLERNLEDICAKTGLPPGIEGEFKWSPGKEHWMRDNLKKEDRTDFFKNVLRLARDAGGMAIVVIEDAKRARATNAKTPEEDVVRLFLERAHNALESAHRDGIVLADRPATSEEKFLASCLATLQQGTDYALPDRIAINVVTTSSHLVRLIQLADVITACTVAHVSGESKWSPTVFEESFRCS
jgi:Protein of unknown function (DUF3800)